MANVVLVVGDTGTGKSTSVRTLNPSETYIINVLNKPLPFKGSAGIYNAEKKNTSSTDSYKTVYEVLKSINEKAPHIKHVVIDDVGFVATKEFFDRSSEVGFSKFSDIGVHMQQIINLAKNCRPDLFVYFMFHEDDDVNDKIKTGKKVKLIGQLLEDKYNPLAIVTVALFTDVTFDKDGNAEYSFITKRTKRNSIIIPAKSPEGMFAETKIPNDLALVAKTITEYYN